LKSAYESEDIREIIKAFIKKTTAKNTPIKFQNSAKAWGKPWDCLKIKLKNLSRQDCFAISVKIAIDEKYHLIKKVNLMKAELKEMKRHPEIGYRILSTVSDMEKGGKGCIAIS